jgi:hypothetical protein
VGDGGGEGDLHPRPPVIAARWAAEGRHHAGVLLCVPVPRMPYGEVLRRRLAFLNTVTAEEMRDQVRWLDPPEGS